eukprot:UN06204
MLSKLGNVENVAINLILNQHYFNENLYLQSFHYYY